MGKVKVSISMSLDGYVAGPDQSKENPLGIGGEQLHEWVVPLRAFRERHGEQGGEVNASTPIAEGVLGNVGATIMGRNMFGGGPGPWGDDSWKGWWGDDPPYHSSVFVLTHHAREPVEMQGGTTFYFVTDGIESALEQARAAAGDKDVSVGGGAAAVNQYLAAGLLDEILVSIVPLMLGSGARLFDNLGDAKPRLEQVEAIEAPGVTHIRYARGLTAPRRLSMRSGVSGDVPYSVAARCFVSSAASASPTTSRCTRRLVPRLHSGGARRRTCSSSGPSRRRAAKLPPRAPGFGLDPRACRQR